MSESYASTRARIAAEKRWRPDRDVSNLQEKAARQFEAEKVQKLAESLNPEQRQLMVEILAEPQEGNRE